METVFTEIYKNNIWYPNQGSGIGSTIEYNKDTFIPFLRDFIINNKINSIVDLGSGDFECGPYIYNDLTVKYTGYDVYKHHVDNNNIFWKSEKIEFKHLDFYKFRKDIVSADLCIIKDVLQHWEVDKIYTFLDYLVESKKYKYILIINCCGQTEHDTDVLDGGYRPLNSKYYPLLKYNCQEICRYNTKQVNLLTQDSFTPTC